MKSPISLTTIILLLAVSSLSATTRYVWQDSPSPGPPYTSWVTAARVIQDAVDVAAPGDEIIVTNGLYATGGRAVYGTMTNRVAVDRPLTLRSVNGPQVTVIQGAQAPGGGNGDGAIRCVYLTDGASLSGFTLTNGATQSFTGDHETDSGGGLWCESATAVVSNCVLTGNSAWILGGGAYCGMTYMCTLNNCTLTGNSAGCGGGAACGILNNCMLSGNSAEEEGGDLVPPFAPVVGLEAGLESGVRAVAHLGNCGTDVGAGIAQDRDVGNLLAVDQDPDVEVLAGDPRPAFDEERTADHPLFGQVVEAAGERVVLTKSLGNMDSPPLRRGPRLRSLEFECDEAEAGEV